MKKVLKDKKGMTSIFIAISFVVLLGFTALAVDVGQIAYQKSKLQNATDASALAGGQKLPADTVAAETIATQYVLDNDAAATNITVSFADANHKITVKASQDVALTFARVLGILKSNIQAQSTAIVGPKNNAYSGLRPFGVVDDVFTLGQQVVLREGVWDAEGGNFGTVNFDGSGANIYKDAIINGSKTGVEVGGYIDTEPGGMVGPTVSGIKQLIDQCPHIPKCTPQSYVLDCPRVITVPLIDTLDVNGRSEVQVLGFARFFLEGARHSGGHTEITGTFVEEIDVGGVNPQSPDFGLRSIKLID